jgi:phospholipase C
MKSRGTSVATLARPTRREVLRNLGTGLGAVAAAGCDLPSRMCRTPSAISTPGSALLANVDALVVLVLENRSFDHYLGHLGMAAGSTLAGRVDGLHGDESNIDVDGQTITIARMPGNGGGTINPHHDHVSVRETFNHGRNDAFLRVNADIGPRAREVLSYLDRDHLPFLHALAERYTVCDRWFSSYMGQTWPNRYYLHATTSQGRRDNHPMGFDAPPTIWERLADVCVSAKNYAAGPVHWYTVAFPTKSLSGNDAMVPAFIESFFRDARAGTLPAFSLIDPDFKVNDGYPGHDLALNEAFVASIVRAMAESPQWARSLLVITFDEHGGYFDHVAPPLAVDPRRDFRQLGFRVPAILVGPTVRQGGVVSTTFDHDSVAAPLRTRFGLHTLGKRMDAANELSSCIDPALLGAPAAPPRDLPMVELDRRMHLTNALRATSQSEVQQALETGETPSHLVDGRADADRLRSWLRVAQDLGAVKVRG